MSRHWVLGQTIIRNIFLLFWRNFRVYIFWSLAISQCLLSDAKLGLSQWLISTRISPHLAYNGAHNICLALDKSEGITCITCIWKKKHLQMSVSPGRHWICGLRRSGKRQFTPFCFLASPTHFPPLHLRKMSNSFANSSLAYWIIRVTKNTQTHWKSRWKESSRCFGDCVPPEVLL